MPAVAELLTVTEVACRLRQTEDTIRRKIAAGELEAVRLGEHGPLRIPEEALAAHLQPASGSASVNEVAPVASQALAVPGADEKAA